MALTFEEIQKTITEDKELATKVKEHVIGSLKSENYFIRSKDEENDFLTNYEKNILGPKVEAQVEEKVKTVVKGIHDRYDQDLFELTGEKKGEKEKTYEFLKRKLSELAKQKITDQTLADKIKVMEEELAREKQEKEAAIQEKQKTISDVEQRFFHKTIDNSVSLALNKFMISVPAEVKTEEQKQLFTTSQKSMIKNDFLTNFEPKKDGDGNIVYYDKAGKIQINTTTGKAMTEEEIISRHYAGFFMQAAKTQNGTGVNGAEGKNKDYPPVKNKTELAVHLQSEKKLTPGSPEFNKQYKEISTALALTE